MIVKFQRAKAYNWLGVKTFAGATAKIGAPLDKFGAPVTGLNSKAEELEMEEKLGLEKGSLAKTSAFWDDYYVLMEDKTIELDTSVPEHELMYKFLKAQKKVAKNKAELRTNAGAVYVLFSDEEEAKIENVKFKSKALAYALVNEMSPADMRQVLLFYGKGTNSALDETVANIIYQEVDRDPSRFVDIVQDPALKNKAFILECVRYGVLTKRGSGFALGEDQLAPDMETMVEYLNKKDNQQMIKHLKEELKHKK